MSKTEFEKLRAIANKKNEERRRTAEKYQAEIDKQRDLIAEQTELLHTLIPAADFEGYGKAKTKIREAEDIISLVTAMKEGLQTGFVNVDKIPEYLEQERKLTEAYREVVRPDWARLKELALEMAEISERIDKVTDDANEIRADLRESYSGDRNGGRKITTRYDILRDLAENPKVLESVK